MRSATQMRVLTAAILIPLVIAAIWWGPTWLVAGLAAAVAIVAMLEFFTMGERLGSKAYGFWTCLAAVGIFAQQWYASQAATSSTFGNVIYVARSPQVTIEWVLFMFVIGTAIIALGSDRPLSEVFSSISVSAAGLVMIVLPFSAVVRLRGVAEIGPQLLLFTLVLVWIGDTAAYFVGRSFGRWKLSPQVSPNKTWEGAVANLLGALVVGLLFGYWTGIEPVHMLAMAGLGSIAGQMGDLFESAFKRSAGVKDSGAILPGHGGMLDRIDALILAAPTVWYYFQWVVMRRY